MMHRMQTWREDAEECFTTVRPSKWHESKHIVQSWCDLMNNMYPGWFHWVESVEDPVEGDRYPEEADLASI